MHVSEVNLQFYYQKSEAEFFGMHAQNLGRNCLRVKRSVRIIADEAPYLDSVEMVLTCRQPLANLSNRWPRSYFAVDYPPVFAPDGTVYVRSRDKQLYALRGKSGVKLWEFETGNDVFCSPALGSDGTVNIGSSDRKLYAIKTDSKSLFISPSPMRGQNAQHTGRGIGIGSSEPTELNPTNPEPS
jgi:hypothetical protein